VSAANIGAICFGLVIGWITYRTLRRAANAALSDIATVVESVGGAAVTALFTSEVLFGLYSIGLAIGFFLYFIVALLISGTKVDEFMGD
jgi:hypothetical protein